MQTPKLRTSPILLTSSGQSRVRHHFNHLRVQWAHVHTQALLNLQGSLLCLVCSALAYGEVGSGKKISAPLFACQKESSNLSCHALQVSQSFHWAGGQWTWRDPKTIALERIVGSRMCYGKAYFNNRVQAAHTFDVGWASYGGRDNHSTSGFSRSLLGNRKARVPESSI